MFNPVVPTGEAFSLAEEGVSALWGGGLANVSNGVLGRERGWFRGQWL